MTKTDEIFVNIIDSPSPKDVFNSRADGRLLSELLRLNSIQCMSRTALDKELFTYGIKSGFLHSIEAGKIKTPILHISCHGSTNGIQLSCGEVITWEEFKGILSNLSDEFKRLLVVCMSSCEGIYACKMAFNVVPDTFCAIVGPESAISWPDSAIGFASFYHLLSKGYSAHDAVVGMRAASGIDNFHIIEGGLARQAYLERVFGAAGNSSPTNHLTGRAPAVAFLNKHRTRAR